MRERKPRGKDKKPRKSSRLRGEPGEAESIAGRGAVKVRRSRVVELAVLGKRTSDIAAELGVPERTIQRDLAEKAVATEIDTRLGHARQEAERLLKSEVVNVARSLVAVAKDGNQFDGPKVKACGEIFDRIGLVKAQPIDLTVHGAIELKPIGELEHIVRSVAAGLDGRKLEDDET